MATRRWKGKAKDVIQVDTITIGGTPWVQGETITITCDGIDFVVTIGTLVTTSQVATTLYEAFNGSTLTDTSASCSPTIAQGGAQVIPQFAEAVATVASSVVTLTVRTAGKPCTFTCTETSTSGTATLANATVATGKHWFSNADNWTGDTVPVDTDTILFDSGSVPCKYGLTPAIQPTVFIKTKTYTGTIGLPEVNIDNSSKPYHEYRTKYLTFNAGATCTYHFEQGEGSGSGLVRIDAGAGASIFNVYGYGTRLVTGQPCILLTGTNAANVINMPQGDVGVAYFDGETATLVTVRVGNGTTTGATLYLGDGVTLTSSTIDVSGGTVHIDSATATSDIDIHSGGTVTITGTGAHADIDVQDGTCNYRTTGTLTTLAVRRSGTFDKSGDLRAATITNVVQLYPGATFLDPNKSLTLSAGYKQNGGTNSDYTIDVGTDRTFTVA